MKAILNFITLYLVSLLFCVFDGIAGGLATGEQLELNRMTQKINTIATSVLPKQNVFSFRIDKGQKIPAIEEKELQDWNKTIDEVRLYINKRITEDKATKILFDSFRFAQEALSNIKISYRTIMSSLKDDTKNKETFKPTTDQSIKILNDIKKELDKRINLIKNFKTNIQKKWFETQKQAKINVANVLIYLLTVTSDVINKIIKDYSKIME